MNLENLLADAAAEAPPPSLRERVVAPRARPAQWPMAAAASLLFGATLWVILATAPAGPPPFGRLGGAAWIARAGFDRPEAMALVGRASVLAIDGDIFVVDEGGLRHWWYTTEALHLHGTWGSERRSSGAAELFRLWPRLRAAEVVFVAPGSDPAALRPVLEAAVAHPRADVKAAALAALRNFYEEWAVALALPQTHDPEPRVRHAARASLYALVAAPDCDTHDFAGVWSNLDADERRGLLELQWTEAIEKGRAGRCACREEER